MSTIRVAEVVVEARKISVGTAEKSMRGMFAILPFLHPSNCLLLHRFHWRGISPSLPAISRFFDHTHGKEKVRASVATAADLLLLRVALVHAVCERV